MSDIPEWAFLHPVLKYQKQAAEGKKRPAQFELIRDQQAESEKKQRTELEATIRKQQQQIEFIKQLCGTCGSPLVDQPRLYSTCAESHPIGTCCQLEWIHQCFQLAARPSHELDSSALSTLLLSDKTQQQITLECKVEYPCCKKEIMNGHPRDLLHLPLTESAMLSELHKESAFASCAFCNTSHNHSVMSWAMHSIHSCTRFPAQCPLCHSINAFQIDLSSTDLLIDYSVGLLRHLSLCQHKAYCRRCRYEHSIALHAREDLLIAQFANLLVHPTIVEFFTSLSSEAIWLSFCTAVLRPWSLWMAEISMHKLEMNQWTANLNHLTTLCEKRLVLESFSRLIHNGQFNENVHFDALPFASVRIAQKLKKYGSLSFVNVLLSFFSSFLALVQPLSFDLLERFKTAVDQAQLVHNEKPGGSESAIPLSRLLPDMKEEAKPVTVINLIDSDDDKDEPLAPMEQELEQAEKANDADFTATIGNNMMAPRRSERLLDRQIRLEDALFESF
jgi:hypothetical protein